MIAAVSGGKYRRMLACTMRVYVDAASKKYFHFLPYLQFKTVLYFASMKQIILLLFVSMTVFSAKSQVANGTITYKNYTSLPAYSLLDMSSKPFLTTSVPQKGKSLVVVYFSPSCSHCQEFTSALTAQLKDFKNVQFLFVSAYPIPDITKFANERGLQKMANFKMANDPDFKLGTFFELKEIPSVFVYGSNGKLKRNFDSKVKIDELKQAANE